MLPIAGCDVVLEEDRNAFERPALAALGLVKGGGDCRRIGVELAHGIKAWSGTVIGLDPRGIGGDQLGRAGPPRGKRLGKIAERGIFDANAVRGLGRHRCDRGRHGSAHHCKQERCSNPPHRILPTTTGLQPVMPAHPLQIRVRELQFQYYADNLIQVYAARPNRCLTSYTSRA
jgi:hypothetical protein